MASRNQRVIVRGRGAYSWSDVDPTALYNSTEITLGNGTCVDGFTETCVEVFKSGTFDRKTGPTFAPGGPFLLGWRRLIASGAAGAGSGCCIGRDNYLHELYAIRRSVRLRGFKQSVGVVLQDRHCIL